MSDGITKCTDGLGLQYGEGGLRRTLATHTGACGMAFLEAMTQDLPVFSDGADFADDVSAVLLDIGEH